MKNLLFSDDKNTKESQDKNDYLFPPDNKLFVSDSDKPINFSNNISEEKCKNHINNNLFKPWKILIVDDEKDIHTVTEMALDNFIFKEKRLEFLHAYSAQEAKEIFKQHYDIAIILLDVVMENDNSGLDFVQYIRNDLSNSITRIILRTGQPGKAPEKEVIELYDIDDYKVKTDVTVEKLNLVITTGLRNYEMLLKIEQDRKDFNRQIKKKTRLLEQKKDKLEQAKDYAVKVDQDKEHFLINVSHEIRTSLFDVIGISEILKKSTINDEQNDYIDIIISSGENLLNIVNDIVDLSKIEAGKITIQKESVVLTDCIKKIFKLLKPAAQNKNISLMYYIDDDVADVIEGDELRLNQIIINLISNAIKFSNQGVISLFIYKNQNLSDVNCDKDFFMLEFSVKDQGIGINDDQIPNLFKRFSQATDSTYKKYGGTGLGLAISKKLCELMNGNIWVESSPGKGSTFYFTIKTKEIKQGEDKLDSDNEYDEPDSFVKNDTKKLKVLIVDDHKINQKVMQSYIKISGFQCDLANDGSSAIKAAMENKYNLIFMDIRMPIIDGIEATKIIRANSIYNPVIIGVTANIYDKTIEKCLKAGMNDYILKPVTLQMVNKTFLKWKEKLYGVI